jgi:hypothetical protein
MRQTAEAAHPALLLLGFRGARIMTPCEYVVKRFEGHARSESDQRAVQPPSRTMLVPVSIPAEGEVAQTTASATSSAEA